MARPRDALIQIAAETLEALRAGYYVSPSGVRRDLAEDVDAAVRATRYWAPSVSTPRVAPRFSSTQFAVTNESTLAAAERLARTGERPALLNFASATNPGGGFEAGSPAQEESLARSAANVNGVDTLNTIFETPPHRRRPGTALRQT